MSNNTSNHFKQNTYEINKYIYTTQNICMQLITTTNVINVNNNINILYFIFYTSKIKCIVSYPRVLIFVTVLLNIILYIIYGTYALVEQCHMQPNTK